MLTQDCLGGMMLLAMTSKMMMIQSKLLGRAKTKKLMVSK
jgi:hypothetical protein